MDIKYFFVIFCTIRSTESDVIEKRKTTVITIRTPFEDQTEQKQRTHHDMLLKTFLSVKTVSLFQSKQ